MIKRIKFWYQRRTRGFDDSELWSLDDSILRLILPRLKAFKSYNRMGYPADFTPEDWEATLNKMIRAIELWLEHDGMFIEDDPNTIAEPGSVWETLKVTPQRENALLKAEFEEGWKLFQNHFFALWD